MKDLRLDRTYRRFDDWPNAMRKVRRSAFGRGCVMPQQLRSHECWVVRASLGRRLVGVAWGYDLFGDGVTAYIDDVAVHARQQGKGIGKALIGDLVPAFVAAGFTEITGYPTNAAMASIFSRHRVVPVPARMS